MTKHLQLIPVVGTGAAAAMIFNILPVFLGNAAESFALSDSAAGWLATTYLAGFGISSVSASLWLHRAGRRTLAQVLFLLAAVLLAAGAVMRSFAAIMATLFAAGLVLGGLYTLSFVLAGEYPNPTRAVGIKLGGEVALGALLLFLMSALVYPTFGFTGMLVSLAMVLVAVSPCARLLATSPALRADSTRGGAAITRPALVVLGALFLFTVGQAAVWSFVERAGARAEFGAAAIGGVLSSAVLLGGAGSFLAGTLSDRFGKTIPLLFAASLYLVAIAFFTFGTPFWTYATAVNLFFFAWLFALPYLVSTIAALDDGGHATSLVTACFAFGSMLGPAVAGELVARGDFGLLYLTGAIATCAAYAIALTAARTRTAARETP
ncbi:MAG: MFS transporter [Gammaproteobacteria bacterium]|nr:MFS transporter [Gammaproteobacteria bacterium]